MKQKADNKQQSYQSNTRPLIVILAFIGYLFVWPAMICMLSSVISPIIMSLFCIIGTIVSGIWGLLLADLLLNKNRIRRGFTPFVDVPVYIRKTKRHFFTSDGTPLEIIEDEDAPLNLGDDHNSDQSET